MKEISVKKASDMVLHREANKVTLKLPYQIKIKNSEEKFKKTKQFSLKFLFNAITLTDLKHPETEDCPEPVDIQSIDSCYIFGSAVNPRYEKVIKKYLFGLYIRETEQRISPSDLDIMCFVNNGHNTEHIKSMTTWDITMNSRYGSYDEEKYGCFDISYIPSSLVYNRYEENKDFLDHIKNHGVCIMGKNIVGAKRYADWSHNTIKNTISCNLPKEKNITEIMIKEQIEKNKKHERFDILDIR